MRLEDLKGESRIRYIVAKEIASKCPSNIGQEIIVVGSVSRGIADENSDIEIEFLSENIPSEDERVDWIREIGGIEITPYGAPIADGSMWIIFKYQDYWIEAGWQSFNAMKANIESIWRGEVISHDRMLLPWVIKNAILLTESDLIESLQQQVKVYPDTVQKKIISSTLKTFTISLAWEVKKTLAQRDDKIPLLERLIVDGKKILRLIFALNREWEPDWKRIEDITQGLKIKPENLSGRINKIITINNSQESLEACFELIKDTLLLIPSELDEYNSVDSILRDIKNTKTY